MKIILGLGNPGPKYLTTRHNAGFRTVDRISTAAKIPLYKMGQHAFWGKGSLGGQEVVLAKPMTYMNNSGLAAAALCKAFGASPQDLLVVYDDLDLPPGTLRLRPQGGTGGHNGLKSITYHLQTKDFPRMRIGIGRSEEIAVVDYVLQEFSPQEEAMLEDVLDMAIRAATLFVKEGINAAMNRCNVTIKNNPLQEGESMLD
ncbi:aminoacyl-tRNA hydrolase [Dethiobacter alkaliphilus]|uniref:Peptidyl-tRNA hydrolase n=1 Tax=Dethiobacter alkaliphilus AHT 1 TaxID=555088 RepID=C0GJD1_DETAL|nr:aminoacyl-tRNA hydrolase [Dethiobacter alkaliphilus]EEG76616.1 Aminoacyl-tRNA hydrolase [Dethiobacter alkaliphilus AHT 1]